MAQLIDGKLISQQIKDELKEEVAQFKAEGIDICLAVIQVGSDPASSVYVRNKKKACAYIGVESRSYELPEETSEEELIKLVEDVGMHRDEANHLCGDVDFADVEPHSSAITPVPGGVGPMTIAMLMNNCVETVRK